MRVSLSAAQRRLTVWPIRLALRPAALSIDTTRGCIVARRVAVMGRRAPSLWHRFQRCTLTFCLKKKRLGPFVWGDNHLTAYLINGLVFTGLLHLLGAGLKTRARKLARQPAAVLPNSR